MSLALTNLLDYFKANTEEFNTKIDENKKKIRDLNKGITDFKTNYGEVADVVKQAGTVINAAFEKIAITGLNFVKAASDAQKMKNVIEVNFGSMSKDINKWAEETANAVNRSDYQMMSFVNTAMAMTSSMIGNKTEAAEMSKIISQLAIDLGSFLNVNDEQAFEALTRALGGEAEALNRLGYDVQDAAVKQYAFNEGIEKSYENMTLAEKTTLRYQLILERLKNVMGHAERTSGSYANQMQDFQGEIRNMHEELGKYLLPVATKIIGVLRSIVEYINDLPEPIKKVTALGVIVVGIVTSIVGPLASIIGQLPQIITGLKLLKTQLLLLQGSFAPFLIGGLIIFGLLEIASAFTSVKKEAKDTTSEVSALASEYDELSSKENISANEKERLVELSEDLAKLFPDAVKGIDEETNAFILNTKAIRDNIAAENDRIKLTKYKDTTIETSALVSEYDKILSKESISTDEKDRLVKLSKDLAKLFPEAIKGIDEETNAIILNIKSMRDNLAEKEKNSLTEYIEDLKKDKEIFAQLEKYSKDGMDDPIRRKEIDRLQRHISYNQESMKTEELSPENKKLIQEQNASLIIQLSELNNSLDLNDKHWKMWADSVDQTSEEISSVEQQLLELDKAIQNNTLEDYFHKYKVSKTNEVEKSNSSTATFDTKMKDYDQKLAKGDFKSYEQEIKYLDDIKQDDDLKYSEKADVEEKIFNLAKANFEKTAKKEKWNLEQQLINLDKMVKQYAISTDQIRQFETMTADLQEKLSNKQYKIAMEAYSKEVSIGEKTAEEKSKIFQTTMKEYGISLAENEAASKQFEQIQIDILNERLKNEAKAIELEKEVNDELQQYQLKGKKLELTQLKSWYEEKVELFQKYKLDISTLTELYEKKISAIEEKYDTQKEETKKQKLNFEDSVQKQINQITLSGRELELEEARKKYEQQLELAEKHKTDKALIDELYKIKLKSINDKYDALEKDAELKKQKFLLQQKELNYHEYLNYINQRLAAEIEGTDNWYALMTEKQNTLNSIVQNEMQSYEEQSKELFENENERVDWLIPKLTLLKEQYGDNKVIIHLLNEEIKKLGGHVDDLPLNWMGEMFVNIGFEAQEAQQHFESLKNTLSSELTDPFKIFLSQLGQAISEGQKLDTVFTKLGETVLNVLNNILNSMADLIIQRGIIEPFVDGLFGSGEGGGWIGAAFNWLASLSTAHSGALVTPSGLVQNLPSYHTGGRIPGLASDERIIKVLTGERILSRDQNAKFEAGEQGNGKVQIINQITAMDSQDVLRALSKDGGEAVAKAFGFNVSQNGTARKVLRGDK